LWITFYFDKLNKEVGIREMPQMSINAPLILLICDIYVRDLEKHGDVVLEVPVTMNLSVGDMARWQHENDEVKQGPMWVSEILPRPTGFNRRQAVVFKLGKPKQSN
jgi:hypothetical protein